MELYPVYSFKLYPVCIYTPGGLERRSLQVLFQNVPGAACMHHPVGSEHALQALKALGAIRDNRGVMGEVTKNVGHECCPVVRGFGAEQCERHGHDVHVRVVGKKCAQLATCGGSQVCAVYRSYWHELLAVDLRCRWGNVKGHEPA